jgi:hypothetical protein
VLTHYKTSLATCTRVQSTYLVYILGDEGVASLDEREGPLHGLSVDASPRAKILRQACEAAGCVLLQAKLSWNKRKKDPTTPNRKLHELWNICDLDGRRVSSSIRIHNPPLIQTDYFHAAATGELKVVETYLIVLDMRELVEELTDSDDGRIAIDYFYDTHEQELEEHGQPTVLESILSEVVESAERKYRRTTSPVLRLEDVHVSPNAIRACVSYVIRCL